MSRWVRSGCGQKLPRTSKTTCFTADSPITAIRWAAPPRLARSRLMKQTIWSAIRSAWAPSSLKASRSLTVRSRSETERSGISHDELRAAQLAKLRTGLREVLATNPFWRSRLHDVGGWDDFERLPLTAKSDLVADQAAAPPFGTNLTYPQERYVRLHQTSGSSGGHPLRWLDTAESWEWCARIWADHVYRAAAVTRADRVFLAFSFGPFLGFWSAFSGAERLGALCVSGGSMSSEQRVQDLL